MIKRKISEIAEMLHASTNAKHDVYIEGVSIDSRKINTGNLFIPLKGERVNGHHYYQMAVENGAAALLWEIDEPNAPSDIPLIFVEDTTKALWNLAKEYRSQCHYQVVGITGSNGKTSTKDMIAGVLSARYKVEKTAGNHNNEIGVPLTLLSFSEECEVAIVEMGMENLHEIEELCEIVKPDFGVITNVGVAHLENLGSMENIAKAKCELIDGITPEGYFFYNGDDEYLRKEISQRTIENLKVSRFGEGVENECQLTDFVQKASGISFKTNLSEKTFECDILGKHQAMNGCAAILCAQALGLSDDEIAAGFKKVEKTGMRNQLESAGKCTILNDAYKSNPQSAMAALATFEAFESPYKVVVFGDMLELGETSPKLHEDLGKACADYKMDELYCIGEMARYIMQGAESAGIKTRYFENKDELVEALLPLKEKTSMLLVKGSRGMKLDEVVERLK